MLRIFLWSLIWTGQVFLTILIWRFVLQATVHSLIWIFSLIPVRYFFHTNHTERLPTAHLTAKNVCPTYRLRLTSNFLFSPKLAPQQSYLLYIVELTYRRGIWAAARPDDTPNWGTALSKCFGSCTLSLPAPPLTCPSPSCWQRTCLLYTSDAADE